MILDSGLLFLGHPVYYNKYHISGYTATQWEGVTTVWLDPTLNVIYNDIIHSLTRFIQGGPKIGYTVLFLG